VSAGTSLGGSVYAALVRGDGTSGRGAYIYMRDAGIVLGPRDNNDAD